MLVTRISYNGVLSLIFIFYVIINVLQFVRYMEIAVRSAGNFCSFIVVMNKVINTNNIVVDLFVYPYPEEFYIQYKLVLINNRGPG